MTDNVRQRIKRDATLVANVRQFFDGKDFIEVFPRCLTPQCVVDAHIDPLRIDVRGGGEVRSMFLQPSPEAEMKAMLAHGSGSIYAIVPAFRDDEFGPLHRSEFTMLEWYEVGADWRGAIETIDQLSALIVGSRCKHISYRDLFRQRIELDPFTTPVNDLVRCLDDSIFAESLAGDRDEALDAIMDQCILPELISPTIVYDYPLSQAALAKPSDDDPLCARRFEWFASGVELGNGYDELLDVDEMIRRTKLANQVRQKNGRQSLPMPSAFVQAMRDGLPPSSGVAVGMNRLTMVANGQTRLDPR